MVQVKKKDVRNL